MVSNFKGSDQDYLDTIRGYVAILPNTNVTTGKLYNESMKSPLTEAALEMTYNFGNISFLNRNKKFHMVATLGAGIFSFDAKVTDTSHPSTVLRKSGKTTELMLPLSLGFKYKITPKIDLGLALDYRKTWTDNVDATIKTFSEYDSYFMLNLGVNYNFGKKGRQMEWVNPMEVVYNDLADMKEKIDILSGDKDKDGVSDLFDKDSNTPEGTKVYGDGTAIDSDGDGIPDSKDANGVEIDTDGDGVADSRDLEPGTGSGSLVNFQGITIAKAGEFGKDGIVSAMNAKNGANGKNGTGYLPSIYFDLSSSAIKSIYNDRLLVIAKVLKANPDVKVKISGNCDVRGTATENNKLGQKRADAVKAHLVKVYGIDASRISTDTKGDSDPLAKGINAMNRRVDFSVE
jgi:OOP family OmpA-OmpF porin